MSRTLSLAGEIFKPIMSFMVVCFLSCLEALVFSFEKAGLYVVFSC